MPETPQPDDWKHWFARHGGRLLLCARQWTRSVADAEDVVQEAFVRFWKNQRHLGGDPMGLVLTSIRRAAVDLSRREQRRERRELESDAARDTAWFEPVDGDDGRRIAIEEALRLLPPEQREVLVLKIWGERTFEEIGSALAISPNTAASRYRYALSALRRHLTHVPCHG